MRRPCIERIKHYSTSLIFIIIMRFGCRLELNHTMVGLINWAVHVGSTVFPSTFSHQALTYTQTCTQSRQHTRPFTNKQTNKNTPTRGLPHPHPRTYTNKQKNNSHPTQRLPQNNSHPPNAYPKKNSHPTQLTPHPTCTPPTRTHRGLEYVLELAAAQLQHILDGHAAQRGAPQHVVGALLELHAQALSGDNHHRLERFAILNKRGRGRGGRGVHSINVEYVRSSAINTY